MQRQKQGKIKGKRAGVFLFGGVSFEILGVMGSCLPQAPFVRSFFLVFRVLHVTLNLAAKNGANVERPRARHNI